MVALETLLQPPPPPDTTPTEPTNPRDVVSEAPNCDDALSCTVTSTEAPLPPAKPPRPPPLPIAPPAPMMESVTVQLPGALGHA